MRTLIQGILSPACYDVLERGDLLFVFVIESGLPSI